MTVMSLVIQIKSLSILIKQSTGNSFIQQIQIISIYTQTRIYVYVCVCVHIHIYVIAGICLVVRKVP